MFEGSQTVHPGMDSIDKSYRTLNTLSATSLQRGVVYLELFNDSPVLIHVTNDDHSTCNSSESGLIIHGKEGEEYVGHTWSTF